ncbi:MAG: TonB family protein [Bacteroidales bacterium]|nr:TonB family protein [Bacteroidales bacterium]
MYGKSICKYLKSVRRAVADANGIELDIPKCTYEGDCSGTCPQCEAEVRTLENALSARRRMAQKVAVLGVAAGLSMAGIPISSAQSTTPEKMHSSDTVTVTDSTPSFLPDGMVPYIANGERVHCAKATLVRPRAKFTGPIATPRENPYLIKSTYEVEDIIKKASFPGGYGAMAKYISKNAVYPTAVAQQGIVGTVGVEFLVRANGRIDKVRTIQSVHPLLDAEAVRLVASMPPWNPTIVNGRKKAFYYEVYIVFSW